MYIVNLFCPIIRTTSFLTTTDPSLDTIISIQSFILTLMSVSTFIDIACSERHQFSVPPQFSSSTAPDAVPFLLNTAKFC